ncbi:MAG TPA: helix-turn-helix transcriptional regulator [Solirubrobacteraceae bacterium]|jgi:transcriptional regulator with XRE-family HTH domain|nr:helix-turn-helix transcriptional regulator [Solirubrobacteraceae bacterium]
MNDAQAVRLGRLLAQARRNKSLSLRAVAELAGVAHLWLMRVEHGLFNQPAPERIMRVAEVLDIDPERIDRITKGHVSNNLPGVRTYFRAKYDLSQEEIDQIESTVNQIQRNHERRDNAHDHDNHPN